MSNKQKKTLVRILVSFGLFAAALLIPAEGIARLAVFLVPLSLIHILLRPGLARLPSFSIWLKGKIRSPARVFSIISAGNRGIKFSF